MTPYLFFKKVYVRLYRMVWYSLHKHLLASNPQFLADYLYFVNFYKRIDWEDPKDLNEIINYLEFNTDISLWTQCADKYRMRDYVKSKGLESILVPLCGKWDNVEDITLNELPEKFAIKTNNGYGDVVIVKDKADANLEDIKARMRKALDVPFGLETAEIHYTRIKPCIVAEKLLEPTNDEGLIDYKVWCLNGEPYGIFTCSNRDVVNHHVDFNVYDLGWNCIDDRAITKNYRNSIRLPKPANFELMLKYAAKLSEDFVESRVDFYNIDGDIYVGEITLTSKAGRMDYFTLEYLLEMGTKIREKWKPLHKRG